jgi:hypothetical protein
LSWGRGIRSHPITSEPLLILFLKISSFTKGFPLSACFGLL